MTLRRRSLLVYPAALIATTANTAPIMPTRKSRSATIGATLEEVSASDLAAAMSAGHLTSEQLVQRCQARIASVDKSGPRINSIIELNPDAALIARQLDLERKGGHVRGPLHGLPVLLKDNIATGDRMPTTAGSRALAGVRATHDAHIVKRLREAGAVVLGKTNLSEWANIRSTRSTSGWSGVGGLTRNPYALDRSTSGSSSGTGAALAASLAPLGIGTETDGSIVSPSSINGLVGLKPTIGRVSRDGIVPISHSQDTAGPMTRSVSDAALLYAGMAGPDDADPVTQGAPSNAAEALTADSLRGARIGIARAYLSKYDEVNAQFDLAVAAIRAQGAEIIDDIEMPAESWSASELSVLLYELKHDLPLWLRSFAPHADVKSLADVIAFNRAHADVEMPWFRQELFEQAEALGGLDSPDYVKARQQCLDAARDKGLQAAIDRFKLDAIVAPTGGVAWLIDPIGGDNYGGDFAGPAAVAGFPHLTVPAGFVQGLPVGVSFVGKPFSEWRLLNLGYAFEQATKHRRAPTYRSRSVPV